MIEYDQVQIIRLLGLAFVAAGLLARFGAWKKWFWKTRTVVYGYIPLGLLFILFTYSDQVQKRLGETSFLYYIPFGLLMVCVVWFSQRPMQFLKPNWVRWMEVHPRRIIKLMEREVEAGQEWKDHLVSQTAVDAWAKSLKGKLPRRKK